MLKVNLKIQLKSVILSSKNPFQWLLWRFLTLHVKQKTTRALEKAVATVSSRSLKMSTKPSSNVLQPVDLNSRTNRRYTILGSGITGANKDRLSVGGPGDQRRRASVVPKVQRTPSRRVSMMPGTGTTTKSPGRNINNNPNPSINKTRLSMVGPSSR